MESHPHQTSCLLTQLSSNSGRTTKHFCHRVCVNVTLNLIKAMDELILTGPIIVACQ